MHAVLKIRSSRWIQIYYAPERPLNNIWAREINVFLYASQSWRNRMKFNGTMCPVSFQNLQHITKIFRTSNKLHKRHILHVWDILFNKISLLSFNFINSWVFLCVIFSHSSSLRFLAVKNCVHGLQNINCFSLSYYKHFCSYIPNLILI